MEVHLLGFFLKPFKLIKLVLKALYAAFPEKNEKYQCPSHYPQYSQNSKGNNVLQQGKNKVFPRNFHFPFRKAHIPETIICAEKNLQFAPFTFLCGIHCLVSPYFKKLQLNFLLP